MLKIKRVDWTSLLKSANSVNEAGELLVKLLPPFLIFTMEAFLSTKNLLTLLLSSIDDRLVRLLHVATLPITRIDEKTDDDNGNMQNSPSSFDCNLYLYCIMYSFLFCLFSYHNILLKMMSD